VKTPRRAETQQDFQKQFFEKKLWLACCMTGGRHAEADEDTQQSRDAESGTPFL
jgi:hypothetical protein